MSVRRQAELPPGRRAWAFDLPRASSSRSGAPKRYIAASVGEFVDVYIALAGWQRHAYEVLQPGRAGEAELAPPALQARVETMLAGA